MLALMARDPDALAYAIKSSCENKAEVISQNEKESGLKATLNLGHTFGHVLHLLVNVYQKVPFSDFLGICQCLMFLDDPDGMASILEKLLRSENKDDALLAFQIAFDLVENEHQAFLLSVRDRLTAPESQPSESVPQSTSNLDSTQSFAVLEDVPMTEESSTFSRNGQETDPNERIYAERLTKIQGILSGETSVYLTLQFLYSHNKSDLLILKTIKQSVEVRNSVTAPLFMPMPLCMLGPQLIHTLGKILATVVNTWRGYNI